MYTTLFKHADTYLLILKLKNVGSEDSNKTLMKATPTFVAQQASPVPLAVALPGGLAGPVHTAGEDHAVVAELALPAELAPVR